MISVVLAFALVVGCRAFPPYSQSGTNSHQRFDPVELSAPRGFQTNRITHCDIEDLKSGVRLRDLQLLVEAMASRKGVSPYIILSLLMERLRMKTNMEDAVLNTIEGASLQELMDPGLNIPPPENVPPPLTNLPPLANIPLLNKRPPYSVPPMISKPDDTSIYIVPMPQSIPSKNHNWMPPMSKQDINSINGDNSPLYLIPQQNRLPGMMTKSEVMGMNEPQIVVNNLSGEKMSHIPVVFPLMSSRMLKPPLGATVRVNTGDPRNPIPDVIITVSPLMTLVEALRQAEIKYQNAFGLNHDSDIIVISHSQSFNCFVISRFNEVRKNQDLSWKVTVEDRDRQEVYEDVCLPDAKEVIVKPGTLISLSYVPL